MINATVGTNHTRRNTSNVEINSIVIATVVSIVLQTRANINSVALYSRILNALLGGYINLPD